jgi:hypothetical protein
MDLDYQRYCGLAVGEIYLGTFYSRGIPHRADASGRRSGIPRSPAKSAVCSLTEDDVATLNSCTTENRIANSETPPKRAIIRLNRAREQANLVHLRAFAEARGQKIYLFPARHDAPTGTNLDHLTLLRMVVTNLR